MNETVLLSNVGSTAIITLNRPEKLNAWDTPMREALAEMLGEVNASSEFRSVVITGSGDRAFSAGQDLDETMHFSSGHEGQNWFLTWRDFYDSVRNLDKPCIAALNGVAAGSAFQFAMLTDIRVGHANSHMGQPEINSGIASVLGPLLMAPRIGLSRTIELTLTGRMMDGVECETIGLIQHLVDQGQVTDVALEIAEDLGKKPPVAMRLNRQRFREMTQPAFDEAFSSGTEIQKEAFASGEPQAAMKEFFEQRKKKKKSS
mgnify:FL=1